MKYAIIIHGAFGNPKENWFPWLKRKLEKNDYKVKVPKFPTPREQTLKNWLKVFSKFEKFVNDDTILISHSLGSSLTLRFLERTKTKVRACFMVAPFLFTGREHLLDAPTDTFLGDYGWKKIKGRCSEFYVFGSTNDKYVPVSWVKKLTRKLNAKVFIIKNGGHFNEDAGYLKFPLLLKEIKRLK